MHLILLLIFRQVVSIAARDYRMIRRIPGEAYPGDHLRRQGSPLSPHQLQQMQASLQQQAQYATLPGIYLVCSVVSRDPLLCSRIAISGLLVLTV